MELSHRSSPLFTFPAASCLPYVLSSFLVCRETLVFLLHSEARPQYQLSPFIHSSIPATETEGSHSHTHTHL